MTGADDLETRLRDRMLASLEGDAAAYRALLDELALHLRSYFARRLAPTLRSHGEDLVQETLMAVHTRRMTYDPNLAFTAWAYAIARYKLIDLLRRNRIRQTLPLDEQDLFADDGSGEVTDRRDVDAVLSTVPERTATLIRQTRIEGLTIAEAAKRAGMSETAAKVSIHRGLKSLVARFGGGGK